MIAVTSSSLAFRSLLKSSAARAGLDRPGRRLTGLTPQATAFHAALVAQETPVFLVVPTDADVERMTSDARLFLAALLGLSELDAAGLVLPFPSQEVDPYRELSPHLAVASARARALHALATRSARLVVASARALMPRLSDAARLAAAPRSRRRRSVTGSRWPGSLPRIRWTSTASSAFAAVSWTSIRRPSRCRSAWSSSATSSSPSAGSTARRSDRRPRSTA
jgi:hypothetical protein